MAKKKKSEIEEEKKLVDRLFQRFRKSEQSVVSKHDLMRILDKMDRGEQWKNQEIPPWVPKPTENWVRYVRTLKRANLSSAIPTPVITPKLEKFSDFVDKLSKAHQHVWEEQKVQRTIRRCIDRSVLLGTSIVCVYNDDTYIGGEYYDNSTMKFQSRLYQGNIYVKRISITNFFHDPDAYRLEDMKYCETTDNLPLATIKNNKAFREYVGDKLDKIKFSDLETDDNAAGTIFERDVKPNENGINVEGDEMVTLHTHWERKINEKGKYVLNVYYYLPHTDFLLYKVENVKPNEYPFAVLYDEEEEQEFLGSSTCMDFLENQKIINRTSQVGAILGTLHQNPQKVVSRESGINAQDLARTGTLPGKTYQANGDPSKAIHVLQPVDIPKGLFELEDRMKNDIRERVGINEAYTGQSVGSLTTSTGVNSLIERATIRDKDKMIQIDEFVERISHLIMLFILHKWRDKRPITYTASNGMPVYGEYEPVPKEFIDNIEWIIKSDVYAKAPTTQASRRQQADQLMQLQGQFQFNPPIITPEEWIQFQDFDMREEILRRMQQDRMRMEQQRPEQLTQQIMQVAQIMHQGMMQGLSQQEIQQQALQITQEIVAEQEKQAMNRPRDAAQEQQAPQGTTGQMAMNAMARGM